MSKGKKKYMFMSVVTMVCLIATSLIAIQNITAKTVPIAPKQAEYHPYYQWILGYESGENDVSFIQAGAVFGEQFNLSRPILLCQTKVKIGTSNPIGGGNVRFDIYRCGNDNIPVGQPLASSEVQVDRIPLKTYDWVYETYTPVALRPGKYAVTASYDGLITTIGWKKENPGMYEMGTGIQNLGFWSTSNDDYMFGIYGFPI